MKLHLVAPAVLALSASLFACASETNEEQLFPEDRCTEEGVSCDAFGRAVDATEKLPAYELGTDEKPAQMTLVHQSNPLWEPVDLEFNPRSPRDLWINNYRTGHMTVVKNIGTKQVQVIERRDVAYAHFQNKPPAFAFGSDSQWGQTWGTCGDGNNGGNFFMGPTLYTANLDIFGGNNTATNLGSHLDMLHSTSYCRGISWAGEGNQYFAFNSHEKSIDFYDFKADHGPGWDDHSDGVIRRYWTNQVKGVDGLISAVSWNAADKKLYVADTGNKRILALDPSEGLFVAPFPGYEPIVERAFYEAPVVEVASGGLLEQPSGLEASGDIVFTTDALTSQIHAISIKEGTVLRSFATNLPPGSLAGLNFGPDGKIYFVDRKGGAIYRLDP
ncbi:MAG: hypothetical protein KIT84_44745 [Labilithrix sp.]|nr:hypothetical protein [Labilithrix sp.]MCW5818190.1 hypothetical protein [Labilithrix sp.]